MLDRRLCPAQYCRTVNRSERFGLLRLCPWVSRFIAELDDAIKSGSKDKRVETLRRITDLFVAGADRFNDNQIEVFDNVLGRLIERIEARALVELGQRLAPINNAPLEVVRRLARQRRYRRCGTDPFEINPA